uniref:SERPIN domain-containing protein n=1 Tax=Strongyloides venezuelensis TaxID=75913 RepID=A0A0K0EUD3_STRVS
MSQSNDVIVNSIADFSLKCLKELNDDDASVVFSPMSLIVALSMAYSGAKGKTIEEFASLLKTNGENNQIHEHFLDFIQSLKSTTADFDVILKTANKIYVNDGFKILDSYSDLLTKYYDGQFESIDFKENVNAANKINAFVSDATNNKIENLISSDAINELTRVILVNCLYFSGDWSKKFKDYNTYDDVFHKDANSSREIKYMKRNDFETYSENENSQLILLDYCCDKTKFGILLPKKKHDIFNVLNDLNGEKLFSLINNASVTGVEIHIPKFKIESSFTLNGCLKKLGLGTAFSEHADFSGITDSGRLFISQVVQKVFIDVNEKGTEAAAATGVIMELMCLPITPEKPIIFKADHPFFFFILHDNKHILFNGIYM